MAGYIVGVDGGGTKTKAKVISMDGSLLFECSSGSLNLCSASLEDVDSAIKDIFTFVASKVPLLDCRALCAGVAGVSNKKIAPVLKGLFKEQFSHKLPVLIVSDAEIAFYDIFARKQGCMLASGTGSYCIACTDDGRLHRVGGGGHLIDDEGSGYALGREALSHALRVFDGRDETSVLFELLAEQKQLTSFDQVISYAYQQGSKASIAALAPIVFLACEKEDQIALNIIQKAALDLFHLVECMMPRLHEPAEIAFSGGVLENSERLVRLVKDHIVAAFPNALFSSVVCDASKGAALLALEAIEGD